MPVGIGNGTATLDLSALPKETKISHVMPRFLDTLLSIKVLCDTGFHCTFTNEKVFSHDPSSTLAIKLQGWHDESGLWRFPLVDLPIRKSTLEHWITPTSNTKNPPTHKENNAYDLPIIEAVAKYHHATAGFPVKETWLEAIKSNHCTTWIGLPPEAARKYCPDADETILGTMSQ